MNNHRATIIRSLVSIVALFLLVLNTAAQAKKAPAMGTIKAAVDQRIELTSIVARLAEYGEYKRDDFKSYAVDVDEYFGKYRSHPAIEFAKKVRESNGIGFDAVPSLAVHLRPDLSQKMPFSDAAPEKRWGKKDAEEFARLLKQFAADTKADAFFASHAAMYKAAEERMQKVIDQVDFAWYQKFYGEMPQGSFNLYIGLLNGGMNFGPKVVFPDGKEEFYAIIGAWQMDAVGMPNFTGDFLPTIIHEFNHSFINHLYYRSESLFAQSGPAIFKPVAARMARQAYADHKITFIESMVRAAVARYVFDHQGIEKANSELIEQRNRGFLWIDELFTLMGTYENNRKAYPTFRSFIPVIAGYTNDLARRIDDKVANYEKRQPKVAAVAEIAEGAVDVDPNLKELTIVFDQPLGSTGYSFSLGSLGREHFPIGKPLGYSEDKLKFKLEMALKPDTEYEFIVTGNSFRSKDGIPLRDHTVKFKTRKM